MTLKILFLPHYVQIKQKIIFSSRIWLRPGQEVAIKVTLLDALGRELLDENGPKVSWEIEPHHPGIHFKSNDRLFVEHHPDYLPVPVPYKFYQVSYLCFIIPVFTYIVKCTIFPCL